MNRCYMLLLCLIVASGSYAQLQNGEVSGYVFDEETGKRVSAEVTLRRDGFKPLTFNTDSTGYYIFTGLAPGGHSISAKKVGYAFIPPISVSISASEPSFQNIMISRTINLGTTVIPKRQKLTPGTGGFTKKFDEKLIIAIKDPGTLLSLDPSVTRSGDGNHVGGNRGNATRLSVNGGQQSAGSIVTLDLEQVEVNVMGLPASMGDLTGGQISFTTKMPSAKHTGSVQLMSSNFLDPYHYNHIEVVARGPLLWKSHNKDSGMLLGYTLAGNYIDKKDAAPAYGGIWQLSQNRMDELIMHPLVLSPGGQSMINRAETYNSTDLVKSKVRPNASANNYTMKGKLVYQPGSRIVMSVEGNFSRQQQMGGGFGQSMFNFMNPSVINFREQTFIFNMTHTLKQFRAEDTSRLAALSYSIRFNYLGQFSETEDASHGKDFFDYGYVGKFVTQRQTTYKETDLGMKQSQAFHTTSPYTGKDTVVYMRHFIEQQPIEDTALVYIPGGENEIRSRYSTDVMDNFRVKNLTELQSRNGLRNGDDPASVYGMWGNIGSQTSQYRKSSMDLYNFYAVAEARLRNKDIKNSFHDLQFGLQYEQRTYRGYSLNASGLWGLMRQLSDQSQPVLDREHALIAWDQNGYINDTVRYNTIANPDAVNAHFMNNLKSSLAANGKLDANGRPVDANSRIDIDNYNPGDFNLNMFSADELLNGGKSSLVQYYGYDYLGKKVSGKPSFLDFLNNGSNRTIGAFRPAYMALFVQDNFQFKDLYFRIGLRVDRYDANQPVLKDPYSLYPVKTAGQVRAENSILSKQVNASVSDDAYVYVNDVDHPDHVMGYRTGDNDTRAHWYNSDGVEMSDPGELARNSQSGQIAPYLVDAQHKQLNANSFTDYRPKLYVMPRIWMRIPVGTYGQFFANYDVYTQRPPEGNFSSIDDYYFLPQRTDRIINNPALRPTRKTDYAIGFKQVVGKRSSLGITAAYSELRNLVQVYRFNYAYPASYTSFANLDFSTVKGLRAEYEYHKKGLNIMFNYMLQYADGTGSNAFSGLSLVNSGQPNLRSVFPLDYDIRHNIKMNMNYQFADTFRIGILRNVNINVSMFTNSGLPYTKIRYAVNEAQSTASRTSVEGSVNGNRLPWQFNADVNIEKAFNIRVGKKDSVSTKGGFRLVTFIWIQNILNVANPLSVYSYTGSAKNDGYLASPAGQQQIENLQYAQAFADLYNARVMNPANYSAPRQIRLGVRFDF